MDREAPGIVHLLLASSLQKTPFAALARPVAGTVKNTLVVTLPGSVKAVKENLEALFESGVVNHAIDLLRGGSGKQVHAQLAGATPQREPSAHSSHSHSHGHHHHHHHSHGSRSHSVPTPRTTLSHDPSAPVSARHRVSPYPIITLESALESIFREVKPLEAQAVAVTPDLRGSVLAEDIFAPQDVPATFTTNVDGYAVRCKSFSVSVSNPLSETSQLPTHLASTRFSLRGPTSSPTSSPLDTFSASTPAPRFPREPMPCSWSRIPDCTVALRTGRKWRSRRWRRSHQAKTSGSLGRMCARESWRWRGARSSAPQAARLGPLLLLGDSRWVRMHTGGMGCERSRS